MSDIVEFLTARLDEDEARIRDDIAWWWPNLDHIEVYTNSGLIAGGEDYIAPLIDPAVLLADIEAKRAILQLHAISSYPERWGDVRHHPDQNWPHADYIGQLTGNTVYSCAICDQAVIEDGEGPLLRELAACETVLHLAAVYADRPGYKAEWRVDLTS